MIDCERQVVGFWNWTLFLLMAVCLSMYLHERVLSNYLKCNLHWHEQVRGAIVLINARGNPWCIADEFGIRPHTVAARRAALEAHPMHYISGIASKTNLPWKAL